MALWLSIPRPTESSSVPSPQVSNELVIRERNYTPRLADSRDEEFDHFRDGQPPCRPIFLRLIRAVRLWQQNGPASPDHCLALKNSLNWRAGAGFCLARLGTLNVPSRPARRSLGEVGRAGLFSKRLSEARSVLLIRYPPRAPCTSRVRVKNAKHTQGACLRTF